MDKTHDALFISSDGFMLIKTIPKHFSTYNLARRVDHYEDSFPSSEVIIPSRQTTTYYKTLRNMRCGDWVMPVFSETGSVPLEQPEALNLLLAMTLQNELLNSELADRKKDLLTYKGILETEQKKIRELESRNLVEQGYISREDHQSIVDDYDSTTNDLISTNRELRKVLSDYIAKEVNEKALNVKIAHQKNNREKGPSAVEKAKEHTFQRGPIIYCQGDYLDD